jgi:hypothetical protein
MNSKTPRTDNEDTNILEQAGFVEASFARQLEIELNAVTAELDAAIQFVQNGRSWNSPDSLLAEIAQLNKQLAAVIAERDALRMAITEFCEGQKWACEEWKNQDHIKPMFDLCSTK